MRRILAFCFGVLFILMQCPSSAYSAEISIDDLLIPEGSSIIEGRVGDQKTAIQNDGGSLRIDDLLGPEDNFPFRTDNHRDSGTGKFNAF